jgi:uncharacterized protein YaaQ
MKLVLAIVQSQDATMLVAAQIYAEVEPLLAPAARLGPTV